jgi:hypothetical protein
MHTSAGRSALYSGHLRGGIPIVPWDEPQNLPTDRTPPAGVAIGKGLDGIWPLGFALHTAMGRGAVGRDEVVHGAKPRHNYRYACAELIRLYYRGQELLSDV